ELVVNEGDVEMCWKIGVWGLDVDGCAAAVY
ncbi:hypothetical protein A2U01_0049140, partial [Trifolium medium]|nr:hypothetical protein [Trifolium medium]